MEMMGSGPEVDRKYELQMKSALEPGPHDRNVIRGLSTPPEDAKSRKLSEDPSLFPERMPPECMELINQWVREQHNKNFPCSFHLGSGSTVIPRTVYDAIWRYFTKEIPRGDILGARIYTLDGRLVHGDVHDGIVVIVLRNRRFGPWIVRPWIGKDIPHFRVWSGAPSDPYGLRSDIDIHRYPSMNQQQPVRAGPQPQSAPQTREPRPSIDPVAEVPRVLEVARTVTKRSTSSDHHASKRLSRLKASAGRFFQTASTEAYDELSSDSESDNDHGFPDCSHCGALTTRGKCHFRLTDHPLCKRCYQFRQKYGVNRPLEEESLSQTNARLTRSSPETVRRGHGRLEVGLDADDEEEGHVPALQTEKEVQTSLTEIPESPKTPELGYFPPSERVVDPELRSATASRVYPVTPLSLSRKVPSEDKRGTTLHFLHHATNTSTRQKSITACSTVGKLFAHAVAGGVFPPTMLPGSRVLSVDFEDSDEIMMLVEEDDDDFKELLDRVRHSDSVFLNVRAVS